MGLMRAEIPPEITEYKERLFFGLTARQLACVAVGATLAVPTGMFGSKIMPQDVVEWLVVLEVIPCAAVGWLRFNDMPFEKYAVKVAQYFFANQKRKFIYEPDSMELLDEIRRISYQNDCETIKNEKKMKRKRGKKQ